MVCSSPERFLCLLRVVSVNSSPRRPLKQQHTTKAAVSLSFSFPAHPLQGRGIAAVNTFTVKPAFLASSCHRSYTFALRYGHKVTAQLAAFKDRQPPGLRPEPGTKAADTSFPASREKKGGCALSLSVALLSAVCKLVLASHSSLLVISWCAVHLNCKKQFLHRILTVGRKYGSH